LSEVQLEVESLAVNRRHYVYCSTAIFGATQRNCYSSRVKIRYQETASGDSNRLRTAVNYEVRGLAVALHEFSL
jgi:hypothetical protein